MSILYMQIWAAVVFVLIIASLAIREVVQFGKKDIFAWVYMITVLISISQLILYYVSFSSQLATSLILVVAFSSVMSDISAYFFGNFFGKHKLPRQINANKSWEGIVGQIVGAIAGFYLILPILQPQSSIIIALVIGVSSTLGDILNSIIKRRINIKDWGKTIPGHGGVLDRFASLSFAIIATFWYAQFFK